MSTDVPVSRPAAGASFPTTHWSIVLDAGAGSASQARAALETLCRQYWYPLYAFVRRVGHSHHEAEDCTQEFFARLLAAEGIARARPERGRFRTFLLTAVRNFLINEWHRARAAKRGAGAEHVSLDLPRDAADRFSSEPQDAGLTPEEIFDRNWARELVDQVEERLEAEYARSGRSALFAVLRPMVWDDNGVDSHAHLAATLGMNAHAFTVALQRLRRRFGDRLRARIAETVAEPSDVDAELRYLVDALTRRTR